MYSGVCSTIFKRKSNLFCDTRFHLSHEIRFFVRPVLLGKLYEIKLTVLLLRLTTVKTCAAKKSKLHFHFVTIS